MSSLASDSSEPSVVYDLLGVGFGPASLALAVALTEHNQKAGESSKPINYSSIGGLQEALKSRSTDQVHRYGREPSSSSSSDLNHSPTFADDHHAQNIASAHHGPLNTCFLEKHDRYRWHPGMMLEGSTMQISFLKDLATLRNPQSSYTFLSYLASFTPSRLVSFISRETFTPSRREYADYMGWAARKVEAEMQEQGSDLGYGEEVIAVEGVVDEKDVKLVKVTSRVIKTGETKERFARNLVLSTGGYARIPEALNTPEINATGRVMHSSVFLDRVDSLIASCLSPLPTTRPLRFASFGSGQSAAETFLAIRSELASRLPQDLAYRPEITLYIRKANLRPADDSPFSNEVFDPAMSQAVYGLDPRGREIVMKDARATNYSVVNPTTLATIYELMYAQKVEEDIAQRDGTLEQLKRTPKLIIQPYTEVVGASTSNSSASISLALRNLVASTVDSREVDAVICGTGYDRQGWKNILFPASPEHSNDQAVPLVDLFDRKPRSPLELPSSIRSFSPSVASEASEASANHSQYSSAAADSPLFNNSAVASSAGTSPAPSRGSLCKSDEINVPDYGVTESYRLQLPTKTIQGGAFKPRVWLQGSCESTHGISDSLLSVLAVRSGEVVTDLMLEGFFDE